MLFLIRKEAFWTRTISDSHHFSEQVIRTLQSECLFLRSASSGTCRGQGAALASDGTTLGGYLLTYGLLWVVSGYTNWAVANLWNCIIPGRSKKAPDSRAIFYQPHHPPNYIFSLNLFFFVSNFQISEYIFFCNLISFYLPGLQKNTVLILLPCVGVLWNDDTIKHVP